MPDVIIPGPAGRIEGRYQPGASETAPLALILHMHPRHHGTMQDPITIGLYNMFKDRGFATLRFNFRGIGRSQGTFDNGIGELADAASALDWLSATNPDSEYTWVAGASFGAWIALQLLMRRPEIEGFITIAPPVAHYDLSFLAPCPASGLVIYGSEDKIAPPDEVEKTVSRIRTQKNIKVDQTLVPGANHFFGNEMEIAVSRASEYLDKRMAAGRTKK